MKTDRVNQFLVTICVFVVLVTQFQTTRVVERERYLQPESQPLGETFDDPSLDEEKYGLFSRLFSRRRVVSQPCPQPQYQPQPQHVSNPYQLPSSDCPDGKCPQPTIQPFGNSEQLVRPADCPDGKCPLVPASTQVKSEKEKTGMVRCSCCGKSIVGPDLHTEWTDQGEPVSPCCDACWQKMSIDERKQSVEGWLRRAGFTDESVIARYQRAVK